MNAVSIDNTSYLAVPINEIELECQPKNRDRPLLDHCEKKMAFIRDKIFILFEENKHAEYDRETKCCQIRRKWKLVKTSLILSLFILSFIPLLAFLPFSNKHKESHNNPTNTCNDQCNALSVLGGFSPLIMGILSVLFYLKICSPRFQRKERLETDAVCREYAANFQRIKNELRAKNIIGSDLYSKDPIIPSIYKRLSNREYLKHASLLFISSEGTSDVEGDLKREEEQFGDGESNNSYSKKIYPLIYQFMKGPRTHQSILYNQTFHKTLEDELSSHRVPKALINIICDYTAEFGPLESFENLR